MNTRSKGYKLNCREKVIVIKKVKNTGGWIYLTENLYGGEITETVKFAIKKKMINCKLNVKSMIIYLIVRLMTMINHNSDWRFSKSCSLW